MKKAQKKKQNNKEECDKASLLLESLKKQIISNGPMTVSDYMGQALGHPKWGYYVTHDPFGVDGDFTTAPEISQMFGEMIGAWLIQYWQISGRPTEFVLAELGPGRGSLMVDILRVISVLMPNMISALSFQLVETSPVLREKQIETLKPWGVPVHHDDIQSLSKDVPLFIIANEFFDALPIRQFQKSDGKWYQRCVGIDKESDDLCFALSSLPKGVDSLFPESQDGDIFETCNPAISIVEELSQRIVSQGGCLLTIDYGHATSAIGDTFQAVKNHQYGDVLSDVGQVDLTAHVDFGALKNVAEKQNAYVPDIVEQGQFLKDLGINLRAETLLKTGNAEQEKNILSALSRLTSDAQMGKLFKVMAVLDKKAPSLAGF